MHVYMHKDIYTKYIKYNMYDKKTATYLYINHSTSKHILVILNDYILQNIYSL